MAKLELEVTADLIGDLKRLAQSHYGESGGAAVDRVVEAAIEMSLLRAQLAEQGNIEIEEPVSTWEFAEAAGNEPLPDGITNRIFNRGNRE